ncbi:tetratricopeptide repeat protein [Pleurocapsales cyanobacterium LEGE 10410]|nr:tetratricopeptide repeat protein [Pleurocapsales cyanobacterium LEGE 10410]
MNINLQSPTPLTQNSQLEISDRHSPTQLAVIQPSNTLDRPTRQQKKTIARIYLGQAWLYFQEQDWHRAIIACKNALESDPNTADAYKILGNILKIKGKNAEALGVYAKALSINPNSASIYANLGSFYAEQKDWQQALDYYQQAVIFDPKLAGAYRSLAQVWEELGDFDQALECFCQAVNLEPEILSSEEYFNFGQELYQQGKVKEASIFYTHGVQQNPQAKSELAELVKMFEELEEWQQAVVYYHKLIALSDGNSDRPPSNKPIRNLLSRAKSRPAIAKRSSKAIASSKVAPRLLPEAQSNRLTITEPSSDLSRVANKALAANQNHASVEQSVSSWNNLGSLYAQKQQWAKAISCYQEAIQIAPTSGQIYRNLAKVYHRTGEPQKAALHWYQAFTLEPKGVKPEEYFSLAKSLLEQHQIDQAIACLRRTIKLKPNFNQAYLILGKLLESQGKKSEAQKCYSQINNNEVTSNTKSD